MQQLTFPVLISYHRTMKFQPHRIATLVFALIAIVSTTLASQYKADLEASRPEYRSVTSAEEFDALVAEAEDGALFVDLRDRADYTIGHIARFDNIAWKDDGALLETWIGPHRRNKEVYLICYGGNRSARAFERLVSMGFTKVTDFTPGWTGYAAAKGEDYVPETGDCGCPE